MEGPTRHHLVFSIVRTVRALDGLYESSPSRPGCGRSPQSTAVDGRSSHVMIIRLIREYVVFRVTKQRVIMYVRFGSGDAITIRLPVSLIVIICVYADSPTVWELLMRTTAIRSTMQSEDAHLTNCLVILLLVHERALETPKPA
jgi:hypothetical protein